MSVEDFLGFAAHRPNHERWELVEGAPTMMVGGTAAHAMVVGNLLRATFDAARARGCRALTGLFTRVADDSLFEPDLVIRCGPLDPRSRLTDEADVVFEVLSPSTMQHDRVVKFERYRAMPTLRQIVLVYQDSVRVESWTREGVDWRPEVVADVALGESLAIASLDLAVPLIEIYDGLHFSEVR